MRTIRIASGLLVVAAALVATGPAAGAAVGPSAISTTIGKPTVSCTGDTVAGTVDVTSSAPVNLTVTLLARQGNDFAEVGRTSTIAVQTGSATYSYRLDAAGLSPDIKQYRVRISTGGQSQESRTLPTQRCAPDAVVPEVPSAVLLPTTLITTGLVVLGLRRRRDRAAA